VLCGFNRLIGCHKRTGKILARYEELICAYPTEGSAVICNHGNWQGRLEYADRRQYGEGAWAEFEGLRVRVPEQYDAYLTQKYNDWRADLPPEEQVGHHYYSVMDTQKPYTEYLR
jgi:phosphorylcholine metabolism protein LicD